MFEEQAAATAAMRGLSGEPFYDKDLVSVLPYHTLRQALRDTDHFEDPREGIDPASSELSFSA